MRLLWAFLLNLLPATLANQCYLEDISSTCAVCWITYPNFGGPEGTTTVSVCDSSISLRWVKEFPNFMVEDEDYTADYALEFRNFSERLIPWPAMDINTFREEGGPLYHIPHANVHSCIASKTACSPFVRYTPNLATHSPAKASNLSSMDDSTLKATFASTVSLKPDIYTIIAHIRFFVENPFGENCSDVSALAAEDENDPCIATYNIAIGTRREVETARPATSWKAYVGVGVFALVLLVVFILVATTARKGKINIAKLLEKMFDDSMRVVSKVVFKLVTVVVFTLSVFLEIRVDNALVNILPFCYLVVVISWCTFAWFASLNFALLYEARLQKKVSKQDGKEQLRLDAFLNHQSFEDDEGCLYCVMSCLLRCNLVDKIEEEDEPIQEEGKDEKSTERKSKEGKSNSALEGSTVISAAVIRTLDSDLPLKRTRSHVQTLLDTLTHKRQYSTLIAELVVLLLITIPILVCEAAVVFRGSEEIWVSIIALALSCVTLGMEITSVAKITSTTKKLVRSKARSRRHSRALSRRGSMASRRGSNDQPSTLVGSGSVKSLRSNRLQTGVDEFASQIPRITTYSDSRPSGPGISRISRDSISFHVRGPGSRKQSQHSPSRKSPGRSGGRR